MIVARRNDWQMTKFLKNFTTESTEETFKNLCALCGKGVFSYSLQFVISLSFSPAILPNVIDTLRVEGVVMKKHFTAVLAALAMTTFIGAGMFLVSANAFLNKNGVPLANSPAQATATAQVTSAEQAQIQQLQSLVAQYQSREAQYQNELNNAGQQLQQANDQIRQYQMVLLALQNRGYIQIDQSGQIFIR
jgi:hypothetical protein